MGLAEMLLAHAPEAARSELLALDDLESRVAALSTRARAGWPEVEVSDETFLRHVGERLPGDGNAATALDTLHAGDLYLAAGLAKADRQAIAELDRRFLPAVASFVARTDPAPEFADEVRQLLRERLLLGVDGGPPKISGYTGRGPLGAWLRMVAVRTALNLKSGYRNHLPLDESGSEGRSTAADPELDYLKAHYQVEFTRAFESTLARLDARQRNVLRLYFLDGMTVEAIGSLYQVNKSTVTRWMAQARDQVLIETRAILAARLKVGAGELDSLMALVHSRLDVSIRRFLKE